MEYKNFCTDLKALLGEYIKANRDLIKEENEQRSEIIRERIKKLKEDPKNYCLKNYLSNKESMLLIDKMIICDLPIIACCNKIILNGLGRGFKNLRKMHNLTLEEFSKHLGGDTLAISPSVISKIENGYITKPPKYELIEKIKRIFYCDEEYIFGINDFPKRHGNMNFSPIRTVTFNSYANIILEKDEFIDINKKLAIIYFKPNNEKEINKIRELLDSLVIDDDDYI